MKFDAATCKLNLQPSDFENSPTRFVDAEDIAIYLDGAYQRVKAEGMSRWGKNWDENESVRGNGVSIQNMAERLVGFFGNAIGDGESEKYKAELRLIRRFMDVAKIVADGDEVSLSSAFGAGRCVAKCVWRDTFGSLGQAMPEDWYEYTLGGVTFDDASRGYQEVIMGTHEPKTDGGRVEMSTPSQERLPLGDREEIKNYLLGKLQEVNMNGIQKWGDGLWNSSNPRTFNMGLKIMPEDRLRCVVARREREKLKYCLDVVGQTAEGQGGGDEAGWVGEVVSELVWRDWEDSVVEHRMPRPNDNARLGGLTKEEAAKKYKEMLIGNGGIEK